MRCKLGCETLSKLALLGESDPNFPWEKSQWDTTAVKKKFKKNNTTRDVRDTALRDIMIES